MEFNQDIFQLGIQGSKELTADSIDSNNSTKRSQYDDLNRSAKKSTDENMETGIGVIIELIDIPMDVVGLVIGKNGTQIKSIQGDTGCQVQMAGPSPHSPGYRQVTLQGAKHQIEHAKILINNVITNRFAGFEKNNNGYPSPPTSSHTGNFPSSEEVVSMNVLIPKENCGSLVGKGGETIKSLQRQLGVQLGLIQDTKEPTGPKPLQITGYPDKVTNAQNYIVENFVMKIAQNGRGDGEYLKNYNNATEKSIKIIVPRETVGRIIGKNGQAIKGIIQASGANVQFNLDEDQYGLERTVIIQGSPNQVKHAAKLVRDFCAEPQALFMHVPADKAGLIIGKAGQTVKQIMQESGAKVQLSKDDPRNPQERVFEITGDPQQVQHAIQLIKIKIGDFSPALQNMAAPQYGGGGNSGSLFPSTVNMASIQPYQNIFTQQLASYQTQPSCASIVQNTQPQTFTSYAPQLQQYLSQQTTAIQAQPITQTMDPFQTQTQQVQQANMQMGQAQSQPDYSAQWVKFYRDVGMHEQANLLEQKIKDHQAKFAGNNQVIGQNASHMNMSTQSQSIQGPNYNAIGQ
uniref:K Homology domain-containing protein n=1 Tax=Acrobeloides nanus TaxID=290746 RepID=A0A914C7L2_9BILA